MASKSAPQVLVLAALLASVAAAGLRRLDTEDLGDGLTLQVLRQGDNKTFPTAGDELSMHYTGTFNGKKFDSSRDRNDPFVFRIGVGQVIAGWDRGVVRMSLGERAVLHVPARLGYGAVGAGSTIPPNADLDFDVELLRVEDKEAVLDAVPTVAPTPASPVISDGGGANASAPGAQVQDIEAPKGSSFSSLLMSFFALAMVAFGGFHGFRWLTSPGDTPPPLLSEAQLAEDDGFMGGNSAWQGRQLVSSQPPEGFSSF